MFSKLFDTLPAKGWLSKPEAELLYNTAIATVGDMLEVGTYYGRSAVLLASFGRVLHCVDPYVNFDSDDPSGDVAYNSFLSTIADRKLSNIVLYKGPIESWRVVPVGFAYLDGDHTYEGTRNQIAVAKRTGTKVIAIHDYPSTHVQRACHWFLGFPAQVVERLAVWYT